MGSENSLSAWGKDLDKTSPGLQSFQTMTNPSLCKIFGTNTSQSKHHARLPMLPRSLITTGSLISSSRKNGGWSMSEGWTALLP